MTRSVLRQNDLAHAPVACLGDQRGLTTSVGSRGLNPRILKLDRLTGRIMMALTVPRRPLRRALRQAVPYAVLLVFSAIVLAPYIWAVFESLKPIIGGFSIGFLGQQAFVMKGAAHASPNGWTLDNYGAAFNFSIPPYTFKTDYLHSMIVACSVMAASVVTSTLAGYVLATYRFRGKETLFILLILTFMVPFTVIFIPLYITVVNLGMANSLTALIVTGLWSPLGILLMRQFIEGIPTDLFEAARLDGASEARIVAQVVVPLSTSAIGVLAIYTFMHSWDDFLWPVVVLHSAADWTLPLLADLFNYNAFPLPFVLAVAMLTMLPVLIVYSIVARFFIHGISDIALHV